MLTRGSTRVFQCGRNAVACFAYALYANLSRCGRCCVLLLAAAAAQAAPSEDAFFALDDYTANIDKALEFLREPGPSHHPFNLIFLDYLARKFDLGDDWRCERMYRYHKFVDDYEVAMYRMTLRLLDPRLEADPELMTALSSGTDKLMAQTICCDKTPLPEDFAAVLQSHVDAGGYDLIVAALTFTWAVERGCLQATPTIDALRKGMLDRLEAMVDGEPGATAAMMEGIALLFLLKASERVKPEWVQTAARAQQEDGGWAVLGPGVDRPSAQYPTLRALWVLLEAQFPFAEDIPFARLKPEDIDNAPSIQEIADAIELPSTLFYVETLESAFTWVAENKASASVFDTLLLDLLRRKYASPALETWDADVLLTEGAEKDYFEGLLIQRRLNEAPDPDFGQIDSLPEPRQLQAKSLYCQPWQLDPSTLIADMDACLTRQGEAAADLAFAFQWLLEAGALNKDDAAAKALEDRLASRLLEDINRTRMTALDGCRAATALIVLGRTKHIPRPAAKALAAARHDDGGWRSNAADGESSDMTATVYAIAALMGMLHPHAPSLSLFPSS